MSFDLHGKTAIVTGSSSGIGAATSRILAAAGTRVAAVARREDLLNALAEEIRQSGGEAVAVTGDITERETCEAIVKRASGEWGRIDILVNNAGLMLLGPVQGAPLEDWDRMLELNLRAALTMTHAVVPHMIGRKSGDIVNISSVAGRTTRAGSAVYNATKWGLNAFTDALRQELAQQKTGIRTTLIEPGAADTELRSHNTPEIQQQQQTRFAGITVLQPEDVARAILYAVTQPPHVSINEILMRPTDQA